MKKPSRFTMRLKKKGLRLKRKKRMLIWELIKKQFAAVEIHNLFELKYNCQGHFEKSLRKFMQNFSYFFAD